MLQSIRRIPLIKNYRNSFSKKRPLHPVNENSDLKGKAKADALRLRDRQEREKLLQQHRLAYQKNLKLQCERENACKIARISEHQNPNQHFQDNKHAEALPKAHVVAHGPLHRDHKPGYATETHEHSSTSLADQSHQAPALHDGQSRSTLGDCSSPKVKCTNCCGRPQVPGLQETQQSLYGCLGEIESSKGYGSGSQFACANRCGVVTRRGCADRCVLKPRVHDHRWHKSPSEVERSRTLENPASRLKGGSGKGAVGVSANPDSEMPTQLTLSCSADNSKFRNQSHRDQLAGETISMVHSDVTDATDDLDAESTLLTSNDADEMRLRGGCGGGCGGGARNSAHCPCGGCGGAACGTCNTCCETRPPLKCCSGNQSRGLPCRCRCSSCSDPCPPCGTCGGQNCGKWNSCAGSGGGKCCFPRNTRRRNGPDCCGGGSGGCGGCC